MNQWKKQRNSKKTMDCPDGGNKRKILEDMKILSRDRKAWKKMGGRGHNPEPERA